MKLAFTTAADDFSTLPFYFNLTHPVGKGYANAPADDVGFVQFCFAAIAAATDITTPQELKDPWSKVRVTGIMDQLTQDGIDAWLADRRKRFGTQFETDGIFSVVPPTGANYGKHTPYAIVGVNYILMHATASLWPRVDKHALAGPIAAAIRKAISSELT